MHAISRLHHGLRSVLLAGATGAALGISGAHATPTPIASYQFDDISGSTVLPDIGSVDGTLEGGATIVSGGIDGNAVSLSTATGGYVNFGNNFNPPASAFTVSIWVETTSTGVNVPVGLQQNTIPSGYFMVIGAAGAGNGVGTAYFYVSNDYSGFSSPVNDGSWTQLVGVFSGGLTSLYVDGQLVTVSPSSTPGTPGYAGSAYTAPPEDLLLGGDTTDSGENYALFDGELSDFEIFGSALDSTDVNSLYTTELAATTPSAVPEPASLALFGTSLIGLGAARRRKRKAA